MQIALFLALLAQDADSSWLKRDLEGLKAEYLVVAPPALAGALDPLCEHRAREFTVAVVRTDDASSIYGKGPAGIAGLVRATGARYLLLAGDADTVPTFIEPTALEGSDEQDLATDRTYGVAVGRFPADTPAELRAMAAKTIAYETNPPAGAWRKRIAFVSGEGGFGPLVDMVIERQFTTVVTEQIPAAYDVEVAYAKPASRYCFYPPRFNDNALRLFNRGALFYTYVGHGRRDTFDVVRFQDRIYPIIRGDDVDRFDSTSGLPIMVVLACSTGEFDATVEDAIGEEIFKRPRGPVAFIGGTRITQPYGNALLGRALVGAVLRADEPRLGEALRAAGAAVLADDDSAFRKQADAMAAMVQGPSSLEPMRRDVVRHYNLLGDPALKVALPRETITLSVEGEPGPNREITVRGRGAGPLVEVTFEIARDKFYHPTYKSRGTIEEKMAYRYTNANNKVILRARAETVEGAFTLKLDLPRKVREGTYFVKAFSEGDRVGSLRVEVAKASDF